MEPTNDQPLKTKSNGLMDKVVKEEADNQLEETRQPSDLQPAAEPCDKVEASGCTPSLAQSHQGSSHVLHSPGDKQEEEPHATHSFEWCWNDKKPTTFTCNKAGTVEVLLKRSPQFNEIARKNNNKELVILRDGRVISSHFPCRLIKNERLTVKYVKAVDEAKQPVSGPVHHQQKGLSGELVMFHLLTKGGDNVVEIMRNPALKKIQEMTVYAYKGEKVKHALKRDGHLRSTVFKKNCALSQKITEITTEMSSLVDDLDGKIFQIILLDRSDPPTSQPGSLDDAYVMQTGSQRSDSDGNPDPQQQCSTTESVDDNTQTKKPKLDGDEATEKMLCEIPDSKTLQNHLLSQFRDLVKGMNNRQDSKLSRIQNLFRVEYGKNAQTCREVKTMKELMKLSDSVCQVRINGRGVGSGFLLFDKFVLTNGHVLKNVYTESTGQLSEKVTVHFSFESLDQMESGAAVEEVAGFEYGRDESGRIYDWALLRLVAHQKLPDVMLTRFSFLPQSGGICIIGHPDCGVKKVDPCLIIPIENRIQVVQSHRDENPEGVQPHHPVFRNMQAPIQMITHRFFENVSQIQGDRQALTYDSCFHFGSSGSPVFDDHCNVVAMHSGGYAYRSARSENRSVIDFGYPLSIIIEHIIVQMVERGRFDVLKQYLACSYAHHQNMMANLKQLVESRNLVAFKNAAHNSMVTHDQSLKTFFDFFSQ